ncbi:MAG: transposase [Pirellulaceae bacterium]
MALVVARVLSPRSKLSTTTATTETAKHTLAEELAIGDVDVHELYAAMDWLATRQRGSKTSSPRALEGRAVGTVRCFFELLHGTKESFDLKHGYSRDRGDRPQIVYGLLCDSEGRPIAIEVFPGNTADPPTFTQIVATARKRFDINRLVFVGDRGMITSARINEDPARCRWFGLDFRLAYRGIRKLCAGDQMSLLFSGIWPR